MWRSIVCERVAMSDLRGRMSDQPIVNKVAASGIVTLDLEELYPVGERVVFDLKPLLWQEIALKEDDLRAFCKAHDWSNYAGRIVGIHCSTDAIIPTWAYMLVATHLQPFAAFISQGWSGRCSRGSSSSLMWNHSGPRGW
jgi:Protein of unknown function (DUF2480)